MTRPASIPADLWDAIPPDLRPAVVAVVTSLEARIADLEARLNQNSSNSSQPPSSDGPQVKPAPAKAPTGKARGGQPGHPKRPRPELPPDTVVELRPDACDRCAHPLGEFEQLFRGTGTDDSAADVEAPVGGHFRDRCAEDRARSHAANERQR